MSILKSFNFAILWLILRLILHLWNAKTGGIMGNLKRIIGWFLGNKKNKIIGEVSSIIYQGLKLTCLGKLQVYNQPTRVLLATRQHEIFNIGNQGLTACRSFRACRAGACSHHQHLNVATPQMHSGSRCKVDRSLGTRQGYKHVGGCRTRAATCGVKQRTW